MELNDDLVLEIISYLPLKFAFQCKVLSKNFNIRISDPKFSQTLYQHQKTSSTVLLYETSYYGFSQNLHKISINPTATTHCETTLPAVNVSISASCKGLLLLKLYEYASGNSILCVFNPLTGAYQLIPHPENQDDFFDVIGDVGLAVDYPTSDQYKLIMIGKRVIREDGYKFYIFSSEGSDGMWHEVQMRMTFFGYLYFANRPVYVHDSMHWLRSDCGIVAFDTKTEEDTILDPPEFINHHDLIDGSLNPGFDTWLGEMQGLLTLICRFKKSTVIIATYDFERSYWRVSHTLPNFIKGLDRYHPYGFGYPVWIENKHPLFVLNCHLEQIQFLYEYDSERNKNKIVAVFDKDNNVKLHFCDMPSFGPTLASVCETLSTTIDTEVLSAITATLDELKRFITDGTS